MLQGYLEELRKTSLLEPEEELELWRLPVTKQRISA